MSIWLLGQLGPAEELMVFNTQSDYLLYASTNTSVTICTHQSGCECTDHKKGLLIIFLSLFVVLTFSPLHFK